MTQHSLKQLLDLAATLPYDESDYPIDEEGIIEVFRPNDVSSYRYDLEEISKRLKMKIIYANTNSHQKYGDLVKLFYLDEKPMFIIDHTGKWLATKIIYYFSVETLNEVREFFRSHSTSIFEGTECGPTLLTDKMLDEENYWEKKLTTADNYPHIVLD